MPNTSEADRAHLAAALAHGGDAHARALSARLRAEAISHAAAARDLPRRHLQLVPAPAESEQS